MVHTRSTNLVNFLGFLMPWTSVRSYFKFSCIRRQRMLWQLSKIYSAFAYSAQAAGHHDGIRCRRTIPFMILEIQTNCFEIHKYAVSVSKVWYQLKIGICYSRCTILLAVNVHKTKRNHTLRITEQMRTLNSPLCLFAF